jgi:hypothetical protein
MSGTFRAVAFLLRAALLASPRNFARERQLHDDHSFCK